MFQIFENATWRTANFFNNNPLNYSRYNCGITTYTNFNRIHSSPIVLKTAGVYRAQAHTLIRHTLHCIGKQSSSARPQEFTGTKSSALSFAEEYSPNDRSIFVACVHISHQTYQIFVMKLVFFFEAHFISYKKLKGSESSDNVPWNLGLIQTIHTLYKCSITMCSVLMLNIQSIDQLHIAWSVQWVRPHAVNKYASIVLPDKPQACTNYCNHSQLRINWDYLKMIFELYV